MKASVRWLRELCPELPDDANALAVRLTAAGLEVEGMQPFGPGVENCLVARVVSMRPHPTRSGLRVVTVDAGAAPVEVVCGAANIPEPGGLVVLAPLGARLPAKGLTIERRTIAGVSSEGMLCSEAELGIGDDADGILVLPVSTTTPGARLSTALAASHDTILEFGLTPNRADGLGHLGLAREAAALFAVPWSPPAAPSPKRVRDVDIGRLVSVAIADPERCPHYGAAVLEDVRVTVSPPEVRWRLAALGVRPISNVVDVTNLVMLEFGHPIHAFDLDTLRGARIVVRRAREGEALETLDGLDRTLSSDDLVICDGEGPIALAGVMGGGHSEIAAATRRILLECAYFDPRSVRRAARRHGLHTEASHRFERGVDWGDTRAALARAVGLVAELSGATALGRPEIVEARTLPRSTVVLRQNRLRSLLGVDVDRADAHATLVRLGFSCLASRPDGDTWEVPTHRGDVSREVDLIEEVARVRGYDAIPADLPAIRPSRDAGPRDAFAQRVRAAAVSLGLDETITHAFVGPRDLEAAGAPPPAVILRNPLRDDQSVMRTSLLPGLFHVLSRARRHGERDARLFAVGTLFLGAGKEAPNERLAFAALLTGACPSWLGKAKAVDVWDAKGLAEGLVRRLLRREAALVPAPAGANLRHLHPRGAAWVEVGARRVGTLGPIHPDVAEAFDIGEGAFVVELDLDLLHALGGQDARFIALPRFPASTRDLAIVVSEDVVAGELVRAVRAAAGDLAEHVGLFDRFVGGNVPPGHASLALRVVYRSLDRTLTDEEIDARHALVLAEVERQFGAQLRA